MKSLQHLSFFILLFLIYTLPAKAGVSDTNKLHDTVEVPIQQIDIKCSPTLKDHNGKDSIPTILVINSGHDVVNDFGENSKLIPLIDFNKCTLVYFLTKASGCIYPTLNIDVKKYTNQIICNVNITQHGYCKPLILISNYILIPKETAPRVSVVQKTIIVEK